jgi:SagB-type dehydrogenase family enzyme
MNNRDMQATWKYHDGTKHSYWSIRNSPHFLDWANRPQPFKIYPKIEPLPLPRDVPHTGVAALSAISEPVPSSRADSAPGLQDLARILYFSAGITKQRAHPGGEIYFRAAACTGALYEIELYVVTGDLAGLDAGVYHFNPADISLRLLRKGDFRGDLAQATAMKPAVAHAPATIICTGTYWRNAWKYQARTYRHFGWDNGTLLANMLAVSTASGLPAEIVLGFVDIEVNRLLDLDTRREVSLCLVPIGRKSESSLPTLREAPAPGLETIPLSEREVEYHAMIEMHDASSLESEEEVAQWRGKQQVFPFSAPATQVWYSLATPGDVRPCSRSDTPHRLWPYSRPGAQRCRQWRIFDLLKGQQDSRLRGRGRSGPAYCLIPSWRFCVSGLPYLPTSWSKSLWPPFTNCFRPRKTAARKWSPDLIFSRNSSGE